MTNRGSRARPGKSPAPPPESAAAAESGPDSATPDSPERSSARCDVSLSAKLTTIDAVRDQLSGMPYYAAGEVQEILNVSPRGACLRCERAPANGTRLLLRLRPPGSDRDIDLVARTRWSRMEYVRGAHGARPTARVGVELIGGLRDSLDRYGRSVRELATRHDAQVAAIEGVG